MRFERSASLAFLILILLDWFVWFEVLTGSGAGEEKVYFLDVGQGDSELLVFPGNFKVLIDAGPDGRAARALEKVLPESDRYIDLALVTHAQEDHFGGYPAVLNSFRIGAFVWNGREPDLESEAWNRFQTELKASRIPRVALRAGDEVRLGGSGLEILSPDAALWESSELNDGALVALARWPDFRGLFVSDAGGAVERYLAGRDIRAEVLKVGHHGSKYSSGQEFLARSRPLLAVVEVGRGNRYGHPTAEALARITRFTQGLFRTDRDGTVEVSWRNGALEVYPERVTAAQ